MTQGAIAKELTGSWVHGAHQGIPARTVDFLAGQLITIEQTGARISGRPDDFRADSGETGKELMESLLPSPKVGDLCRGAVREALASIWSIARIGYQETRGWRGVSDYIVDNGEGCLAYVHFGNTECVGVTFSDTPTRTYDFAEALLHMPGDLRPAAQKVGSLPFFFLGDIPQRTALFWSENGWVTGAEPWHVLYTYSGDVLRGEMLQEDAWMTEASETYELPFSVAEMIGEVSRHVALPSSPICLRREFVDILIPADAPCRATAIEILLSSGAFEVSPKP